VPEEDVVFAVKDQTDGMVITAIQHLGLLTYSAASP
jgi:hypothetical protein